MTATMTVESNQPDTSNRIYKQVTDQIVDQLQQGVIPWRKPMTNENRQPLSLPHNFTTNNFYRGINIILLWCSAVKNNFVTDEWAGSFQWKQRNEQVKDDTEGAKIIFYDSVEKEIDGATKKVSIPKMYRVFNRCELKSYVAEKKKSNKGMGLAEKIAAIDDFLNNVPVIIRQHDGEADYDQLRDCINIPYHDNFNIKTKGGVIEGFYSDTLRQLVKWSGAKHRIDRNSDERLENFGDAGEELIAEFGAAFLCAGFGISDVGSPDDSSKLNNWISLLAENNRALFVAASEAAKAVDYLKEFKPI